MSKHLALINTRLEPGVQRRLCSSRFNGFPALKPLRRLPGCCCDRTGLKPGVNEKGSQKTFAFVFILLTLCLSAASNFAAQTDDAEYDAVAEEYIKTYLAAHPLEGTALGLHEYDGKIGDYSRLALDAELSRLRRFDDRLAKFDPAKLSAGRTNLHEVLPKPYVELAIQIAKGSADFLKKDLVAAVSGLKDEQLRAPFLNANRKAATALNDYAAWLERDKLPKASLDFALGEERFRRFLTQTELVSLPPEKILEIGMAQLKVEQEAFAEAAKKID